MTITTPATSGIPASLSYCASLIFIGVSGSLNVAYGASKATDLPGQIIWGSLAAAVAVVLVLSWPAMIRSLEARRWANPSRPCKASAGSPFLRDARYSLLSRLLDSAAEPGLLRHQPQPIAFALVGRIARRRRGIFGPVLPIGTSR